MKKIKLKVIPGAGEDKIVGERNGYLVVKLTAQPDKGKANKSLIKFLAAEWGIKKSIISVISGERSRIKEILINDK